MKYAEQVIEFLTAHRGRDVRMMEIIRHVGVPDCLRERQRIHKGVVRVVSLLAESGAVLIRPARLARGGFSLYRLNK